MCHFAERLKERYSLIIEEENIQALRDFIISEHDNPKLKRQVFFIENRTNGFLFAVNSRSLPAAAGVDIMDGVPDYIYVVTDKEFLPQTVLPSKPLYKHIMERYKNNSRSGKPVPVMDFTMTEDCHTSGLIRNHLLDYYRISMTNEMWHNFQNPEYVRQNVTILPSRDCYRKAKQNLGRLLLEGKEVLVVLYDGVIGNIMPTTVIPNFSSIASKERVVNRQNLMADKMRGISFA